MQNTECTTVHTYVYTVEYKACYCNKDNCSTQQRAVSYVWSYRCYSYQCSDRCFRQSCPPLAVCWALGCSGGSYIHTYIRTNTAAHDRRVNGCNYSAQQYTIVYMYIIMYINGSSLGWCSWMWLVNSVVKMSAVIIPHTSRLPSILHCTKFDSHWQRSNEVLHKPPIMFESKAHIYKGTYVNNRW